VSLEKKERAFVEKRRTYIRVWPLVAWILLLGLVAIVIYLFLKSPLLVNPACVMEALGAGTLEGPTLTAMAALLPVAMLMAIGAVTFMLLYCCVAMRNERRLIAAIDELVPDDGSRQEPPPGS